jgi:tetratricopeptide (TPR) repeat protein
VNPLTAGLAALGLAVLVLPFLCFVLLHWSVALFRQALESHDLDTAEAELAGILDLVTTRPEPTRLPLVVLPNERNLLPTGKTMSSWRLAEPLILTLRGRHKEALAALAQLPRGDTPRDILMRVDALCALNLAHQGRCDDASAIVRDIEQQTAQAESLRGRLVVVAIGAAMAQMGRAREAIERLSSALEKLSDEPSLRIVASYYLGEAFRQIGDTRAAIAAYERVTCQAPNSPYARLAEERCALLAAATPYRSAV